MKLRGRLYISATRTKDLEYSRHLWFTQTGNSFIRFTNISLRPLPCTEETSNPNGVVSIFYDYKILIPRHVKDNAVALCGPKIRPSAALCYKELTLILMKKLANDL